MTYVELADTAVKIGLGALIAGIFSLLASRRAHFQELDRERMKRRERVIEKTAEDFELAYQTLSVKYERVLGLAAVVVGDKYRINAHDCIHSSDDFPRLHIVESRLLLLGLKKEAVLIKRFRSIAGDFERMALPKDGTQPTRDALNVKLEELFQQRVAIYDRISEYYDDPRKKK